MCLSRPTPPPAVPEPIAPPAPPITGLTQGSAKPAGFSESDGRDTKMASTYDKKRVGSSVLRIPTVGGLG